MQRLRDNPYESEWWRILENESILDPDTNAGKEFRRDFRVPFKVFDAQLVIEYPFVLVVPLIVSIVFY